MPIFSIIQNNLFSGWKNNNNNNNNINKNNKFKFCRTNFIKEGAIYNDFIDISKLENFFENVSDKPIDPNEYDFIFKKINIDNYEIIENIDYKKNLEDFFRDNVLKKWI